MMQKQNMLKLSKLWQASIVNKKLQINYENIFIKILNNLKCNKSLNKYFFEGIKRIKFLIIFYLKK